MYSYEDIPLENKEFFYGSSGQNVGSEYLSDIGVYGCGGSFQGYRSHSQRMLGPSYYSPYGNDFIPSRQTRYLSLLGSICEEDDGTIPYDFSGMGTKFPMKKGLGREYVRSSPPGNMHSYYPRHLEVKYEETYDVPEMMPHGVSDPYSEEEKDKEVNDRKRKFEEEDEFDYLMNGWKLPASKSPIMEAMAFCAIQKWGIEISDSKDQTNDSPAKVVFKVIDFEKYYKYSCAICSKQNPTEDLGSRVKSLRRWFVNFPKKRDRRENPQFTLEVKPDVAKKVYEMIEKYKCQINVKKRRRTM